MFFCFCFFFPLVVIPVWRSFSSCLRSPSPCGCNRLPPWRISGFIRVSPPLRLFPLLWPRSETNRQSVWVSASASCSAPAPPPTEHWGNRSGDQSLHPRMETDDHNQRHEAYEGTPLTVTTATGRVITTTTSAIIIIIIFSTTSSVWLAVSGWCSGFSLVGTWFILELWRGALEILVLLKRPDAV